MKQLCKLMAVLNVTPDSFSDGGKFLDPQAAVRRALEMIDQGADLIDMGAESTRPGSRGVSAVEQLRRLIPVLRALRARSEIPISIDTQSAKVAAACLSEGATIINDISALRKDRAMAKVLAKAGCGVILMHMQGTPQTMQKHPHYKNVVREITAFFRERLKACDAAGIDRARVWLDPGIGFGKTVEHNLTILRDLHLFLELEQPLVVGVSRKGFLGALTGESVPERRVLASVQAGIMAYQHGASVLRVHDVAEHRTTLRIIEQLRT
jgi:dihydropteroate synthase